MYVLICFSKPKTCVLSLIDSDEENEKINKTISNKIGK